MSFPTENPLATKSDPQDMIAGVLNGDADNSEDTDSEAGASTDAEDTLDEALTEDKPEDAEESESEEDDDESEEDESEEEEGEEAKGQFDSDYLYHDEEEGRELFLKAVDPETGEKSIYLTREDAKKGLERQLQFIGKLKAELNAVRERASKTDNEALEELELLRSSLTPETATEILIRRKMPEDLRDLNPDTITDDELLEKFKTAHLDAKLELRQEIAARKEQIRREEEEAKAAHEAAESHIDSRAKDFEFFGITNAEDKLALADILKTEVNGRTIKEMAVLIAREFGQDQADKFLLGQTADMRKAQKEQVAEKAKKISKGVKTKKRNSPGAKVSQESMSGRDMIAVGLSEQGVVGRRSRR